MTWKVYKVVFSAESPLHSGWTKTGNVQRTRLYITGHMLWGALTARITRSTGSNDYADIGDKVRKYIRASYFYPCFDASGSKLLIPFYGSGGLSYKIDSLEFTANLIERSLLTSYTSTSIERTRLAAEEGSLHEIEEISCHTVHTIQKGNLRVDSGSHVYFTGYVFESTNAPSEVSSYWQDALTEIQLGGERAYGLGRLSTKQIFGKASDVFGSKVVSEATEPEIEVASGKPVLAHTTCDGILQGVIEPLVFREVNKGIGSFGTSFSRPRICWSPGSILKDEKTFRIIEFGLWEEID